MRNLNEIGLVNESPVSDATIRQVESILGLELPSAYREFVLFCDEASPEVGTFRFGDDETCISEFFRFSSDPKDPVGILSYYGSIDSGIPENVVPIARDAGDYLVCLDLREGQQAVVLFEPSRMELFPVARSFEDFIDGLYE